MANPTTLDLEELSKGLPGLTPAIGAFLAEASTTCLEHNNHDVGVQLRVVGTIQASVPIVWASSVTPQTVAAWDDHDELAEFGACGIAIILMLKFEDNKVLRRARKGTGFDYWLGDAGSQFPFQEASRLEVSGILTGSEPDVARRQRRKVTQVSRVPHNLPAYIVIVEFSAPVSHVSML